MLFEVGDVLPFDLVIGSLVVYLDGNGVGSGQQALRPLVMEDGNLTTLAAGDEAVVADGQPPGWVHLMFDEPPTLRAGAQPRAGVWGGSAAFTARIAATVITDNELHLYPDPYTATGDPSISGSPSGLVALAGSIVIVGVAPWGPQVAISDDEIATLPVGVAQSLLTGGVVSSVGSAICGWNYSADAPPPPASAIVRTGGPLEGLVGERVRVTAATETGPASVVVVVIDEDPFDDTLQEDISLARGAFLQIGALWQDALTVQIDVLG